MILHGDSLEVLKDFPDSSVAAIRLGYQFVGIERESEYAQIAEKRINAASETYTSDNDAAEEL